MPEEFSRLIAPALLALLLGGLYAFRSTKPGRLAIACLRLLAKYGFGAFLLGGIGFCLDGAYTIAHFLEPPPVFLGVWGFGIGLVAGVAVQIWVHLSREDKEKSVLS